jgi:two-component system, cell cycle sensor histidine kinase and response regulator CckA
MIGVNYGVRARREAEERVRQRDRPEVLGRLAGGVAHEANNQMTVVLGSASFVLQYPDLPPQVREDVQQIRAAADRTAAITQQLLAFSRQQLLQPRLLEMDEVITGSQTVLRRALEPLSKLVLHLGAAGVRVRADPGQFAQVLLNLTINAADAMSPGGVLTIGTGRTELTEEDSAHHAEVAMRPGPYGLVTVTDTGQGMGPATLRKIFDPFFTTKAVGKGTGLGLATVYGIVKQSGGYIWAESELNKGTTFKIHLPVDMEATPAEVPAAATARGAGQTILLVDDESAVRSVATRALEEHGFTVLNAATGEEALAHLARTNDAVTAAVVDVVMPGMDGPEFVRQVKQRKPDLPVLFMSGYTEDGVVRRGLGDKHFLAKPLSPARLIDAVAALVEPAKSAGAEQGSG